MTIGVRINGPPRREPAVHLGAPAVHRGLGPMKAQTHLHVSEGGPRQPEKRRLRTGNVGSPVSNCFRPLLLGSRTKGLSREGDAAINIRVAETILPVASFWLKSSNDPNVASSLFVPRRRVTIWICRQPVSFM